MTLGDDGFAFVWEAFEWVSAEPVGAVPRN